MLQAGRFDPRSVLTELDARRLQSVSSSVRGARGAASALFELHLTTDSRGIGHVLVYELEGPSERSLRSVLAEPR